MISVFRFAKSLLWRPLYIAEMIILAVAISSRIRPLAEELESILWGPVQGVGTATPPRSSPP